MAKVLKGENADDSILIALGNQRDKYIQQNRMKSRKEQQKQEKLDKEKKLLSK